MKVEVLGVQNLDYVSRRSGEQVKGVMLHSCFNDSAVEGRAVESIFISDKLDLDVVYDIKPGMIVEVEYNRRGNVSNVEICD